MNATRAVVALLLCVAFFVPREARGDDGIPSRYRLAEGRARRREEESSEDEHVAPALGAELIGGTNVALWQGFCRRYAGECEPMAGEAIIPASVADHVNWLVNTRLRYHDDGSAIHRYGLGESGEGICVDFALAKRHELRERGYASDAMRLALVNGGQHIVLIVRTERGDVLLDNMNRLPVRLSSSYRTVFAIEEQARWFEVQPN